MESNLLGHNPQQYLRVKGERLMDITSPTVGNSLKGMLPGLSILQKSGEPGYDFYMENMFTRGVSSFNGNQQMLVFIDGFEAPLDNLSSEEIESVSLLKDAAALALYGSRGANGVLLITTKKGFHSSPKIGFRIQTGLQMPTIMDTPMDAYQYASCIIRHLSMMGRLLYILLMHLLLISRVRMDTSIQM